MGVTIAPWLQLPNFMQAAESGARIGLSQAQLAQEERLKLAELAQGASESSGRNALGMAEVDSQNQRAQSQLAAQKLQHNAMLPIEQAKVKNAADRISSEDLFHNISNGLRANELKFKEGKLTVDQKLAADRLLQQQANQDAMDNRQQVAIDSRKTPEGKVPSLDITIPTGPTMKGNWLHSDTTPTKELKHVPMNSPLVNQDPSIGGAPGFGTNYTGAASALSRTTTPDVPQSPMAAPPGHPDGTILRDKSDGKQYKVVSGLLQPL